MNIIHGTDARRGGFPTESQSAPQRQRHSGFTLVEIMIVVVIIGMLAAIGMPAFQKARIRSQNTRLANDLRQFAGAFQTYNLENGEWPADETEGILPTVMVGFIVPQKFETRTVVGGNYDWEGPGVFSFEAGISLRNTNLEAEQALELDKLMDDGDLSTGRFIDQSGAYVWLLN